MPDLEQIVDVELLVTLIQVNVDFVGFIIGNWKLVVLFGLVLALSVASEMLEGILELRKADTPAPLPESARVGMTRSSNPKIDPLWWRMGHYSRKRGIGSED